MFVTLFDFTGALAMLTTDVVDESVRTYAGNLHRRRPFDVEHLFATVSTNLMCPLIFCSVQCLSTRYRTFLSVCHQFQDHNRTTNRLTNDDEFVDLILPLVQVLKHEVSKDRYRFSFMNRSSPHSANLKSLAIHAVVVASLLTLCRFLSL
jgi:hypothetical protein